MEKTKKKMVSILDFMTKELKNVAGLRWFWMLDIDVKKIVGATSGLLMLNHFKLNKYYNVPLL